MKVDRRATSFHLDIEIHRRLRAYATARDMILGRLIERILREFIDKVEDKEEKGGDK